MLEVKEIKLKKGSAIGIKIELPNAPLILLKCKKGFIMCGYLDITTADKLKDKAAVIRGVKSIDEALKSKISDVSKEAEKAGIKRGMNVFDALEILNNSE